MNAEAQNTIDPTKAWESQTFEHERTLLTAKFSPCGKFVFAGGQHEPVVRWDLESGEKTLFEAHRTWVGALAFHADGKRLYTGDFRGTVHCWHYADAAPKPVWSSENKQSWIRAVAVTPDGKHLLTAGNDRVIHVWSADDGSPVQDLAGHEADIYSLAIHPDGKTLVSGDIMGKILAWDLAAGKELRRLDASSLHTRGEDYLADVGGVRAMSFSTDGAWLAAGGMTDASSNAFCAGKPAVLVFDWASGELKKTLRPKIKSDGPAKGLYFLPDGSIASQGELLNGGSSLEFFRPDAEESFHQIQRGSGYSIDLHPDGRRIAVTTHKSNGKSGNSAPDSADEYPGHNGVVAVYSLFEKPAEMA